jgi:muconolactone delta-isomerase
MKILAIEKDVPGVSEADCVSHLKAEAARVWELYQSGVIRELYFRADVHSAVLVLECPDIDTAKHIINSLPLVQERLIAFEIIPLIPYPGFSRLFSA